MLLHFLLVSFRNAIGCRGVGTIQRHLPVRLVYMLKLIFITGIASKIDAVAYLRDKINKDRQTLQHAIPPQ